VSARPLDLGMGALRFLASYAGGIVIGVAVALLVRVTRRVVRGHPPLENTVSLLTPFLAYLPAEELGVSGVLAVVTAGLVLSRFAPRLVSAQTRTQATGFWTITTWVLNGSLFLLVGFQAHAALEGLGDDPSTVLGLALGTTVAVIGVRVLWVAFTPYLIRAIDRRPVQRTMRVPIRQRTVSMWAGFRGAVSLAAALALPGDFPFRDELVAVTLVVILATLLVQGLTLPAVVRWARLPPDPTELDEELRASRAATEAGLRVIPEAAARLGTPDAVRDRVLQETRDHLDRQLDPAQVEQRGAWTLGEEGLLRRAVLDAKREAVVRLRDAGEIDDTVLRRLQRRLDVEELRLQDLPVEE
jgi:CPA1 family monovalent cation:H+ antiporter